MDKKLLPNVTVFLSVVLLFFTVFGCASAPQVPPLDKLKEGIVSFGFEDTDPDESEIGGMLKLSLGDLKDLNISGKYVIYWGSSSSNSGKGQKFGEASMGFTDDNLLEVPQDTKITNPIGQQYFLLYFRVTGTTEDVYLLDAKITDFAVGGAESGDSESMADSDSGSATEGEGSDMSMSDGSPMGSQSGMDSTAPGMGSSESGMAPGKGSSSSMAMTGSKGEYGVEIENVLFEFDKSRLRTEFKDMLDQSFASQPDKDQIQIVISGHADERGSNEYNLALGERRAYAVKQYLVSLGLLDENIRIISYGEEMPIDPRHTEEAWTKNRRAETTVE